MRIDEKSAVAVILLGMVGLAVFAGCTGTKDTGGMVEKEEPQELTKVRLAWFKGGTIIAQYVAQEKGYFEDEGLDVEITYFKSTADAIPSVAAEEIEFGITSNTPVLRSVASGVPIKGIGLVHYASAEEKHISAMTVALAESGIEKPEDLKGKRIAIPYVGGDAHIYAVALLKKHGISPDEVTFVTVPWPFHIDALLKGEVDAATLLISHIANLRSQGIDYNIVMDSGELLPRRESVLIYTSTSYMEKNPEVVRGFLRAFYRGQAYLEAHPEEYKNYLAEYLGWKPEILEELDNLHENGLPHGLPHGGRFDEKTWQDFIKIMVETGFLEEEIPVEKVYTEEYLPDLKDLEGV